MRNALLCMALMLTAMTSSPAKTYWTQDKFEIGGWIAPGPAYITDDTFAQMAAAGFTLLTGPGPRECDDPASNIKTLDICRKHGIRLIVRDNRIHLDPQTDQDKSALAAMIADYKDHPALYGYFIRDEPSPANYRLMTEVHSYLRENDPKRLPYINLYPNYGGPHQIEFDNYDAYVGDFVKTVHPLMLSYDHYSFLRKGERNNFIANLEVVRQDSLKAGIPMWVIIQALQDATRYRPPTLNQMYWQVNTSLVYGAKSIWYFPYWSAGFPDKPEAWHYLGVILPDGKPGPQYASVSEINPKLKRLGPLLMGLTSVSVTHLGKVPLRAKGFAPDDLISSAEGDQIVIGRFVDRENKPVLMVVNRDWDKPGQVSLTLNHGSLVADAGRIGPGKSLGTVRWNSAAKELEVKLAPGEARIIRVL